MASAKPFAMKAMSVGMIFMLIFAVIVVSFLIFFGYGDAQVQKSYKTLEDSVESMYRKTKGSSEMLEVSIPSSTMICFVNSTDPRPNVLGGWLPDSDVQDIISVKGYNAWIKFCRGEEGYVMDRIRVSESFCITSHNEVYIENTGSHVEIELLR